MRCRSSCCGYDSASRIRARMPVSMGLLNVRTVCVASGIFLHPLETILIGQMVADALFVLRLNADAQCVACRRYSPGLLQSVCHPAEAVRIMHLIRIDDSMVDFLANVIEGSRINTVASEAAQRLGMIENFT